MVEKIIKLLEEDSCNKNKFYNDIDLLCRIGFKEEVMKALNIISHTYINYSKMLERQLDVLEKILINERD